MILQFNVEFEGHMKVAQMIDLVLDNTYSVHDDKVHVPIGPFGELAYIDDFALIGQNGAQKLDIPVTYYQIDKGNTLIMTFDKSDFASWRFILGASPPLDNPVAPKKVKFKGAYDEFIQGLK